MIKPPPSYRLRAGYSDAIVTLTDSATKRRRDYWLGPYGSPASRECYHRLLAAWEAGGRRWPDAESAERALGRRAAPQAADSPGPTVLDLVRRYWAWAKTYYRPNEYGTLRVALRVLRRLYGSTPAAEFGPTTLRALREAMLQPGAAGGGGRPRPAWSRGYANHQVRRIVQMFRWAASRELVPAEVHAALKTVEPLKRGRCAAREGRRVGPARREIIDGALPRMNRQIRALVELQLLTGARPGELLGLRAADLRTNGPSGVWTLALAEHKTALRGRERNIYFGPTAQRVLAPFLAGRPPMAFLFSPAEAERERRAALSAARATPLSCGNRPGTNRVERPKRAAGARYTTASYYVAVTRACDEAFPPPERLRPAVLPGGARERLEEFEARLSAGDRRELAEWRRAHRFHPHQLRHNAATEIRRQFGLEAAQVMLGHSSAVVTEAVYAERDASKAAEIARKIG